MAASQEQARTPNGELTVDVLKKSYLRAVFPNPFEPNDFNDGDPSKTHLAYARLAQIPFSPYWSAHFEDWTYRFNNNPTALLSSRIFEAAQTQDGIELRIAVAEQLADRFPGTLLEAHVKNPLLDSVKINTDTQLSPLAQFLIERRGELEGSVIKLSPDARRDISPSWIAFAHLLQEIDPATHDLIYDEIVKEYDVADEPTEQWMEYYEGMMGGYNIFDRNEEIRRVVAKQLAKFPDLVISLEAPSQEQLQMHGELPIHDKPLLNPDAS